VVGFCEHRNELRVPKNVENLLTRYEPITFSRNILIHRVVKFGLVEVQDKWEKGANVQSLNPTLAHDSCLSHTDYVTLTSSFCGLMVSAMTKYSKRWLSKCAVILRPVLAAGTGEEEEPRQRRYRAVHTSRRTAGSGSSSTNRWSHLGK